MSVHYKFKSALEYDTVTFDGLHISVKDLKNAIIQQKRIGKSTDFDLQVTNAQTKEVYDDEKALIPKNTSLLIARIPTAGQTKSKQWEGYGGDATPPTKLDEGGPIAKAVDLSSLDAPEDDKIKAMMSQSTQDYDPSNYIKIRGSNQMGAVPPTYRCYKCHQMGHWIKDCPLSKGPEPIEIKKSTGIPLSFMVPVDGPLVQGAMMTPNGSYAVPVLDHQTYTQKPSMPAAAPEPKTEIPEDLVCSICSDLLSDAVMIPCCGNSFCDECIRSFLLDSEEHECPDCHEKDISPGTLIPNRFLRNSVANFKNTTGYVKKPVYKQLITKVGSMEINDSKDPDGSARPPESLTPKQENIEEKTVISEADSTEHSKTEEKPDVDNKDLVKKEPEPSTDGPPGVSPGESPKVTISTRQGKSTRERERSSRPQQHKSNRTREETSPRRHRRNRRSPHYQDHGRNEERPGTPTIDEPGMGPNQYGPPDMMPYPPRGGRPPLMGMPGPPMQGPPPNYPNQQPPMSAFPPTNGPPPNFRCPPPGPGIPPYMAPGPYQPPPRPLFDSTRPPLGGPPPLFSNYPPNSRSHHGRDYPVNDRRMRGRTPSGVIDDPLAAFNRMLREKDEQKRRAKRIQQQQRRSYSRSRSRSRSYSRSPRRMRSRSPRRRQSRSRSRSFSVSRSRSRSFSGSVRGGSPFREFSPRHSPRERRRAPSRFRSPARSPPRHRFKESHPPERFRDREHPREYDRDHDHDRDREYPRDEVKPYSNRDRDGPRGGREVRDNDRDRDRDGRVGDRDQDRDRGRERDRERERERDGRDGRDVRESRDVMRGVGDNSYGGGGVGGGFYDDRGRKGGAPHWGPPGPLIPEMAPTHHHHRGVGGGGSGVPEDYYPPPPEIQNSYQPPPNRYPPRDYGVIPTQMPPHLLPHPRQYEDIAPPGVEEPPIPGLEQEKPEFDRYGPSFGGSPPHDLLPTHLARKSEERDKRARESVTTASGDRADKGDRGGDKSERGGDRGERSRRDKSRDRSGDKKSRDRKHGESRRGATRSPPDRPASGKKTSASPERPEKEAKDRREKRPNRSETPERPAEKHSSKRKEKRYRNESPDSRKGGSDDERISKKSTKEKKKAKKEKRDSEKRKKKDKKDKHHHKERKHREKSVEEDVEAEEEDIRVRFLKNREVELAPPSPDILEARNRSPSPLPIAATAKNEPEHVLEKATEEEEEEEEEAVSTRDRFGAEEPAATAAASTSPIPKSSWERISIEAKTEGEDDEEEHAARQEREDEAAFSAIEDGEIEDRTPLSLQQQQLKDELYDEEAPIDSGIMDSYGRNIVEEDENILEIHTTDIDLKTDLDKSTEMLAHMPGKSKWEVDDDLVPSTSPKGSSSPKPATLAAEKKVTNEVLKRAENAIFAKAINAIRPIEIKKISIERAKLYCDEKHVIDDEVIEVTTPQATTTATSSSTSGSTHSRKEERAPPTLSERKRIEAPGQPVKLSIKDRLGIKVDDSDKIVPKTEPTHTSSNRNRSRTISPFSRRTEEAGRNYGLGERRKVEVVEKRRRGGGDRSPRRDRDRRHAEDHSSSSRRRDRHRQAESSRARSRDTDSRRKRSRSRRRGDDHKEEKETAASSKKRRSRSSSDDDKERRRQKRKDKKPKKEKQEKTRKHGGSSNNKDDDASPAEVATTTSSSKTKQQPVVGHDESKTPTSASASKPTAIDKRKPTIDEATFEPDYDLESESEDEKGGGGNNNSSSPPKKKKTEEKKSSSSSDSSSDSSSEEDASRKRKKHKKHAKKKRSRKETSSSSSESESESSEDEKDRKRKKHKKKQKKRKKSKHK